MISSRDGFIVEDGCSSHVDSDALHLTYRSNFIGTKHDNYVGRHDSGELLVSILYQGTLVRVVVRSVRDGLESFAFDRRRLHLSWWKRLMGWNPTPRDVLAHVKPDFSSVTLGHIHGDGLEEDLCALDDPPRDHQARVGVLYVAPGQSEQSDILSNREGSSQYDEFLSALGEKVNLHGFSGYPGGLDVSDKLRSGEHSVYTKLGDEDEIMFHVCTLMPYFSHDTQQLARKKHIGNDRCIIVFLDGVYDFKGDDADVPMYDPSTLSSKNNHVVIAVSRCRKDEEDELYYRVSVARKESVPAFGPDLPSPPVFASAEDFAEFCLQKALNGVHATRYADEFRPLVSLQFANGLRELISHYTSSSSST